MALKTRESKEATGPGTALRELRQDRGLRVGEMARAMNISYSYLTNIEAGRRRLTPELAGRAATLLGVRLAALLTPDQFGEEPGGRRR